MSVADDVGLDSALEKRRIAEMRRRLCEHRARLNRLIVQGLPTQVMEDWLRKLPEEARSEPAEPSSPGAKPAVLRYRRLQACAGGTLLEVRPETGRMHQIRVQAARRGWPVRGDQLYGAELPFGPPAELPRDRAVALHARSLTFLHPIRYEPITVAAPLAAAWRELGVEGLDGEGLSAP